jgi:ELWxxDGT repeat protein
VLAAQPAFLVKDINTTTNNPASDFWPTFGQANGLLYFSIDDGIHGREVWRSDGTGAGTFLLGDFCPGICDGGFFVHFTTLGGEIYFFTNSSDLRKSDGSPAGTVPVPLGLLVSDVAAVNGELILSASTPTGVGPELWASDGTAAGTVGLAEIFPGPQGSFPVFLGKAGGNLFFAATDPTHGRELWKTDGSAAGTGLVKDLDGTSADSTFDNPGDLPALGVFASIGNRFSSGPRAARVSGRHGARRHRLQPRRLRHEPARTGGHGAALLRL